MNQQELIDELRERVARLEAVRPRRRTYNQQQAAERLNESPNTFRKRQREGRGPKGFLDGRVWKFTEEAIEAYLAAQSDGA